MNNFINKRYVCLINTCCAVVLLMAFIMPSLLFSSQKDIYFFKLLESNRLEEAGMFADNETSGELKAEMLMYEGRYADALLAFKSKSQTSRGKWLKRYLNNMMFISSGFICQNSAHFEFRSAKSDAFIFNYAKGVLDDIYEKVGKAFNYYPGGRILIEIYDTKEAFSAASTLDIKTIEDSGTVGISKFNRLMLLSPSNLPRGYNWPDTICHEYIHLVVSRLSAGQCPLWLQEGLAKYYDTIWRTDPPAFLSCHSENEIIKARASKSFVVFKDMAPSFAYLKTQQQITIAFAEVSMLVEYINQSYPSESLLKLIKLFKDMDEKRAVKQILKTDIRKLENRLIEYIYSKDFTKRPGAIYEQKEFKPRDEDEYIGADIIGLTRLGDMMKNASKFEPALMEYNHALEYEPYNPVILKKAAQCCMKVGKIQEAKNLLTTAIYASPDYPYSYELMGDCYMNDADYDNAVKYYIKSLFINPFNPFIHARLSVCYAKSNNKEAAILESETAFNLQPENSEIAELYMKIKKQ